MVKFISTFFLPLLLPSVLAQTNKIRYMPFGDSITEIVCWRGLVYTQLQQAGYTNVDFVGSGTQQNPSGCKTASYDRDNEGHSGFLAIDIANKKQLVDWLKKNPADIITMHLGTNDIVQQNKKTDDIIAAFSTLLQVMRDSNPNVKVIVGIIPVKAQDKVQEYLREEAEITDDTNCLQVAQIIPISIGSYNTQIQALNKAIIPWATSKNTTQSPIWVVDQYTGFASTDLRDGVHPNDSGDTKMAAKWYPALVNAIKLVGNSTV